MAVVGAGMAGATCAQALVMAGHDVHVLDKSRAPGGRLATRRFRYDDASGNPRVTPLDHGAIAFTARSAEFRLFVGHALDKAWLARWTPILASESLALDTEDVLHVPLPDMPALCGRLLDGIPTSWSSQVSALRKVSSGWQVECADQGHPASFDAVVLAIPPAQAATLLAAHRDDRARAASAISMAPCWTLMGIEKGGQPGQPDGSLARPPGGPLAWVIRNDRRPGREQVDCGDFLAVGSGADAASIHVGVEGAWRSGRSMAEAIEARSD